MDKRDSHLQKPIRPSLRMWIAEHFETNREAKLRLKEITDRDPKAVGKVYNRSDKNVDLFELVFTASIRQLFTVHGYEPEFLSGLWPDQATALSQLWPIYEAAKKPVD